MLLLHRLRVEASYPTVSVASVVLAPIDVTGRGAEGKVAGQCFVDFSTLQRMLEPRATPKPRVTGVANRLRRRPCFRGRIDAVDFVSQ